MRCRSEIQSAAAGHGPAGRCLPGPRKFVAGWCLGATVALLCVLTRAEEPADAPPRAVDVLDITFPDNAARDLGKRGSWLPIYLELKSRTSQTETVVVECTVTADKKVAFSTKERVEVSPGAAKRCWSYVRVGPSESHQEVAVDVRSASGVVIKHATLGVNTGVRQGPSVSVLVVSEILGDVMPWPGELKNVSKRLEDLEEQADALRPSQLPDSFLGYQPFDLVILRDLSRKALEAPQIEALRSWVHFGGQVIFAPRGKSSEVFHSPAATALLGDALVEPVPLDGFLPQILVAIADERGAGGPTRLNAGSKLGIPKSHQYTLLDPLVGRMPREIAAATEDTPADDFSRARRLYAERPFGHGSVGLLTFDDQTYRDQESQRLLQILWAQIVTWSMSGGKSQFLSQASVVQLPTVVEALKDPAREVGVRVMVALIGGYILLAGPVLYYILRRLNRLPAVIWAEPLLVVGYVGVIFATAYFTKGVLTKTRLITLITQDTADPIALRESFLSIFSSAEMTYRISAPRGSAYLRPVYKNSEEERPARVLRSRSGELTLENHALAHWQEGCFSSAGALDLGGPGIELSVVEGDAGGERQLKLTNRLPNAIKEGVYYPGGTSRSGYALPAIASGASATVSLSQPLVENRHEKRVGQFLNATSGRSSGMSIIALLERGDEDFKIDQATSVKERLDYFILYP